MGAMFMMRQDKMLNAEKHPWVSRLVLVWVGICQSLSGEFGGVAPGIKGFGG